MKRRVAITGMGVVCPIGLSVATFAENLKCGVSGVRTISLFDATTLPSRTAGEVPWTGPIARDRKLTFAVEAARQAMVEANACGSHPAGTGTLSLGIGLELFSLDDMAAYQSRRELLREDIETRLTFLQTPSDLCVHIL